MFLTLPRHEVSIAQGVGLPYTAKPFYDLILFREKNSGLMGRIATQIGLTILSGAILVEIIVRVIFSRGWIRQYSLLTLSLSLQAFFLNLFVKKLNSYMRQSMSLGPI